MKQNSVAIVTGASQGIGRSTAIRLAGDFSAVVLVARNGDALTEVADQVRASGAEPLSIAIDLSRVESPEAVLNTTLQRYGRVDALLNIAGAVRQFDLFEMTDDEQWYAGMELKLHGTRRLTIRAWDALKANKGSVVFMSGSAALRAIFDPQMGTALSAIHDRVNTPWTVESLAEAAGMSRSVAGAALFLASDDSSFVNRQISVSA